MARHISVATTLPEGVLLFEKMTAREELGRPFTIQLSLLSKSPDLDPVKVVGQPMTVFLNLHTGGVRHFNGIVYSFEEVGTAGTAGDYFRYRVVLRPWFFLLSNTANCRIFQKKRVPDIVKEVCADHGLKDLDLDRLENKQYREWDFLVQYRESDFNFASRILEQEGIYSYFVHTEKDHTLVLADATSSHDPAEGYDVLPFGQSASNLLPAGATEGEYLESFRVAHQLRPGSYVTNDYNFETPRGDRLVPSVAPSDFTYGTFEVFDYPGEFSVRKEGETLAAVRREESQADGEVYHGVGNIRGLRTGALFKISGHPRTKIDAMEFLVTSATYTLTSNEYGSQPSAADGPTYEVSFTAIDSKRPFRAPSRTRKPIVQGPQTAIVVGPEKEEIWVDQYGRVKVQFHWDRYGKGDENSSCWVRVSQAWAGANWGSMHIPRIGQEVIVDFLEGDPDRPIITGRVYNEDQKVPYTLPDNKTQSGIKSRSTPKGAPSNFNEIRFEDKKGGEELFIHAEKTQTTKVKGSQSIGVDGSRSISVGGDESTSVTGTRSATITKKETQTFKADREMKVTGTNLDEITGAHTGTYHAGRTETVEKGGDTQTVVGSNKTTTVHGMYDITADAHFQVKQGANTLMIEKKFEVGTEGKVFLHNPDCSVNLEGGKATITAASELHLVCGGASIVLKSDGSITVSGSQKVAISGGGATVDLSAAGAEIAGTKVKVAGSAMTEISGAMVKIN